MNNLNIAFGDRLDRRQMHRLARQSYFHFFCTVLEFMRCVRVDAALHARFVGSEYLQKSLDQDRGIYVLCMHLGNWELLASAVSRRFRPSHVIVKKVGGEGVNRFVNMIRKRMGYFVIPRTESSKTARAMLGVLSRNELLGFVLDQYRPGEPKIPFFGKATRTNTSLAAIWRRREAPILPIFVVRNGFEDLTVHIHPPMALNHQDYVQGERKNEALTALFNAKLEEIILNHPEQFLWLHDRWKNA